MATFIAKIDGQYLEWSTIVDAPITSLMPLEEFRASYQQRYGEKEMAYLDDRLKRVEATGVSCREGTTLAELIKGNRAGEKETELSLEEIARQYSQAVAP